MAVRSSEINVMVSAATKVARALNRDFGEIEQLQTSRSGSWDFTNRSFQHGVQILIESLTSARPRSQTVIAGKAHVTSDHSSEVWMVSPISGKLNFAHGIPHFAVSIAYVSGLKAKSAVVYDFMHDNLYWAEKGAGAYRNDRRIRVSKRQDFSDLLIGNFDDQADSEFSDRTRASVVEAGGKVRILGSVALDLALVASGVFDGFWSFATLPSEYSAGRLLVTEAGGLTNVGISKTGEALPGLGILASNEKANGKLNKLLSVR